MPLGHVLGNNHKEYQQAQVGGERRRNEHESEGSCWNAGDRCGRASTDIRGGTAMAAVTHLPPKRAEAMWRSPGRRARNSSGAAAAHRGQRDRRERRLDTAEEREGEARPGAACHGLGGSDRGQVREAGRGSAHRQIGSRSSRPSSAEGPARRPEGRRRSRSEAKRAVAAYSQDGPDGPCGNRGDGRVNIRAPDRAASLAGSQPAPCRRRVRPKRSRAAGSRR